MSQFSCPSAAATPWSGDCEYSSASDEYKRGAHTKINTDSTIHLPTIRLTTPAAEIRQLECTTAGVLEHAAVLQID
jgi:hypothetical protein